MSVSFLIGAGFSASFGIPTMAPFYSDFISEARGRYPSLGASLERAISKIEAQPDLESLLSVLNAASEVQSGVPQEFLTEEIRGWAFDAVALRSHLLSYIVERCENFDRAMAAKQCAPLLKGVAERGAVVFSTNYDRVIEHACRSAEIELADGFERTSDQTVSPWCADFDGGLALAKLHGSVTWYIDPSEEQTYLRFDRGYPLPGPDFHLYRGDNKLSPLMIIPTLEKQVLTDPYSHLSHLFSDTLASRTSLLVVMGSSLRDEHLLSAIRYQRSNLVVLVVGIAAADAASRLSSNLTVSLETSTDAFLVNCTPQLLELCDIAADERPPSELQEIVEDFAGEQRRLLSEIGDLDEEERRDLGDLRHREPLVALNALSRLSGKSSQPIIEATMELLCSPDVDLRCTAASNLGVVASTEAIERLRQLAINDLAEQVRIESALALNQIGTTEARQALADYLNKRPEDRLEDLI